MSNRALNLCWPLQMPPTPKAVLISMADRVEAAGMTCHPKCTVADIVLRTCLGKTTVIDALWWLKAHGVLQTQGNNGQRSTYTLTPETYLPDQCRSRTGLRRQSGAVAEPVEVPDRCRSRTGSAGEPVQQPETTGAASEPDRCRSRTKPVPQPVPYTQDHKTQEAPKKQKQRTSSTTLADEFFQDWPARPNPKLLADWLAVRKAKRCTNTQTAFDEAGRELAKLVESHGVTVDELLTHAIARSWGGINATWSGWAERFAKPSNGSTPPARGSPVNGRPSIAAHFSETTYVGTPDDQLPAFLRTGTDA